MKLKNFTLFFAMICVFFTYAIVYSSFYKDENIEYIGNLGKNIYTGSKDLNSTVVVYKSNIDISNYTFSSSCDTKTSFLEKNINGYTFFNLQILDKNCNNGNFYLENEKGDMFSNTHFELNIISDFDLYNKYVDYNDDILKEIEEKYNDKSSKYKLFKNAYDLKFSLEYFEKSRYFLELSYYLKIIGEISQKRKLKYKIPVVGYLLPDGKNPSKMPNSSRPYRANYTDGIHEGWDIDTDFGENVVSIDDGFVVRIVKDFESSNLEKIKKGDNLTQTDKRKNLDILRGNQIWIKTMKGDVVFFGHLSEVTKDLNIGDFIEKGEILGKIGISGVPDENYTDYHLHFEVRRNPYITSNAGKNTINDYMEWNWYFKGEDIGYISQEQYNIFEK